MRVTSLAAAVASHAGKIWKNRLRVFEGGQNFLQNGVLNFPFRLSQSRNHVRKLEIIQVKTTSLKGAWQRKC